MTNEPDNNPPQIIIYETDDKVVRVSVRLEDESVWLTNLQLAQLFQVSKSTVSEHIKNIFDSGELLPMAKHSICRFTTSVRIFDWLTYGKKEGPSSDGPSKTADAPTA